MTVKAIEDRARVQMGFLSAEDVSELVKIDPARPLLIRFGCGRTVVAAALVEGTIKLWEAKGDHVRDVSFPASDPMWRN